jgi:hypothetical protein
MFIFNLNVVFTTDFLKWRQSMCALAWDFLQERNLSQRGSKQLRKKMRHVGSAEFCMVDV